MKRLLPSALLRKKSGSALILVILLTFLIGTIGYSVLRSALTERRINERHFLRLEAKNASYSVVEYAFSDLLFWFDNQLSLTAPNLKAKNIHVNNAERSFFASTNHSSPCHVEPSSLTANVGLISSGTRFINPKDPSNKGDPMIGRLVDTQDILVLGKATVDDPNGGPPITSYASEELEVRDSPLFTAAIFYNPVMEIAPGANMTINGPVHANGDMYVQTSANLTFGDLVTSSGNLFHGVMPNIGKGTDNGNVSFTNSSGNTVSMDQSGSWLDSTNSNWQSLASQTWNGMVEDKSFGIQPQESVAVGQYVPDNPATPANELKNPAHALIEPPDNGSSANSSIESQKYANKAGLYIYVDTTNDTYKIFKDAAAKEAYVTSGDTSGEVQFTNPTGRPLVSIVPMPTPKTNSDGTTTITTYDQTYNNTIQNANGSSYTPTDLAATFIDNRWNTTTGSAVRPVNIDVGVLREAIDQTGATFTNYNPHSTTEPSPGNWNGVVYVELSNPSEADNTPGLYPAVRLFNGSKVPDRASVDSSGTDGVTFATNGAMYVQGNFNADGSVSNASMTQPDTGEAPVALAADAITILSNNWSDKNAQNGHDKLSYRTATTTEVSAAIMTGNVPSNTVTDNYSGGVENFPRFLENWSGINLYYRGSMVCLFQSQIADKPWGERGTYNAPGRKWGFNVMFSGEYRRMPPGTPNVRTYHRLSYKTLTQSEYQTELASIK